MDYQVIQHPDNIAEITSNEILIKSGQDALDCIMDPDILEPKKVIFHRANIDPRFFDLTTGIAGDILQKFVNYHIQVAIIGDFSDTSNNFQALIRESNRGRNIAFVENLESAMTALSE